MGVWKFSLSTKHQKLLITYLVCGDVVSGEIWVFCLFVCFSFIWEFLIYFPKRIDMTYYMARQLNKQVHKEIVPLIYFNGNSMRILFFKVDYMV